MSAIADAFSQMLSQQEPTVSTPGSGAGADTSKGAGAAPVEGQEALGGEETPIGDEGAEGADLTTTPELNGDDLKTLADEEGLNLEDPGDKAMAERILRREMKRASAAGNDEAILTDFEKSIYGQEEESAQGQQPQQRQNQQPQQQQPQQQQPQQQMSLPEIWAKMDDRGKDWKGWPDAHKAELEELGRISTDLEAGRQPDFRGLTEIRQAQGRRMMLDQAPALLRTTHEMVRGMIQEALGPLLPQVNELSQQNASIQAREAALGDLEKTTEFKGIRGLTKPGQGVVKFRDPESGEEIEVDNTPLNRILIRHTEILKIQSSHKDPRVALRLTQTARLKAAMRIHKGQSPESTRQLLDTATRITEKQRSERPRQGFNGGANGNRGNSGPAPVVDTSPTNWQGLFKAKKA